MKILIVGLGLIGASLAKAFSGTFKIDGLDLDKKVIKLALKDKTIIKECKDTKDYDFVIVALPPKATVEFINNHRFKEGAIVSDVCGVKEYIFDNLVLDKDFYYIGTHPMAGKEVGGYKNSSADLFKGASIIFTTNENTNLEALDIAKNVYIQAGFSKLVESSECQHDEIIAYTSQLAHIVSNAYIKSKIVKKYEGFTGGSFQDMTRVARMDKNLWSELFLINKKHLSLQLKGLIENLQDYLKAIDLSDEKTLGDLIIQGSKIKENLNDKSIN